ncbi:hypothetical protein Tco_0932717, partial [Tanacetum coccineum]
LWYLKESPFNLVAYTDSDYARASLDRKSTTGGCQFLWCRLILWQCKKQTVVSNSTTDVEYIAALIAMDSTICIVKNPVFHSKTKRIEIRQHFNRDSNEKKLIQMIKIHTDQNVADLLTKAFDLRFWRNTLKVKGLRKPTESEGFEEIVDFMNANHIKYALTINPTIYYSCVKQFWDTVKSKMVNEEVQLQALVDKKKVIITKSTIRRDLQLEDANGVDCLPNAAIFELLTLRGNIKREGKGFSGKFTPLFQTMMVQAHEEMGEGPEIPTDPYHTPIITQPSLSQPQRKQKSRKSKKKNTEVPQPSGSTDNKVLDLEKAKTAHDSEIATLNKKVKKLERRNKSRTQRLKRLRKEDASKQGRKIADIDADAKVTLINETQGRNDDNLMFDIGVLDEQEVEVEKVVSTAEVITEKPSEFTTTTTTTTPAASKPSPDKGKARMIESEKALKKKDQIIYDQEVALNLQAQLQAELEEEERLTR